MAKASGLGDALFISGYDLSGDTQQLGKVEGTQAEIDTTGIDKSAKERILGVRDGGIDYTAFFNPETIAGGGARDAAHKVLSALPTADQLVSYCRGTALGGPVASLISKQLGYAGKRASSGEFTFDISALANGYGLEWGVGLTAGKRTDTAGTSGTGVDMGLGSSGTGPSTFGAQFYLHVFSVTGTSITVKIQESSDNGVGDAWTDVVGGGFTAATGITSQRIATASNQTVERYLRVTTTGVFTNAVFAVAAIRNDVATTF
ncbi:hypothetical protein GCM10027258_62320 [Amycolatopsis stemonae]